MVRAGAYTSEAPSMAGLSPGSFNQRLPTPSPYSFSVASATGFSSAPPIHLSCLSLRFVTLILSFASALSLATPQKSRGKGGSSFTEYPGLIYCLVVSIWAFVYSGFQLFKGVCDMSYRGLLISDKISDYLSFVLDQMTAYLLISSSSVGIQAIQKVETVSPLWKAAIVSDTMSYITFLAIATCALFSGYKLCKRTIW